MGVSLHDGSCIDGGAPGPITIHLPGGTNFTWDELPPAGDLDYAFALERAILLLSPGCTTASKLPPNADNGPGTALNLWLGRLEELPSRLDLSFCGCGVVLYACGSGGCTGDNVRYMRHFAALGLNVIAPDTMASPSGAYPRARPLAPALSKHVSTDGYWCAAEIYSGDCIGSAAGGQRPACYGTSHALVLHDPAGWAAFYERVYTMRQRELDYVVERLEETFGASARLFLAGSSEGGMVAARYTHPSLERLNLVARIVTEWSCEFNYFVSCAAHADMATMPRVPVFNVLSTYDRFFGGQRGRDIMSADTSTWLAYYDADFAAGAASDAPFRSVASTISRAQSGYGAFPLTGSCASQMRSRGVKGASFTLDEPYHGGWAWSGSLIRALLQAFVAAPERAFQDGALFSYGGVSLPTGSLCQMALESQVVSATACRGLAGFIGLRSPDAYNGTRCGWRGQSIRPHFVSLDSTPRACVADRGAHAFTTYLDDRPTTWVVLVGLGLFAGLVSVGLLLRKTTRPRTSSQPGFDLAVATPPAAATVSAGAADGTAAIPPSPESRECRLTRTYSQLLSPMSSNRISSSSALSSEPSV